MIRNVFQRITQLLKESRVSMDAPSDPRQTQPETIYPDDTFIVSYPKSGNTWVRFLIGNYLTGGECSFTNCHRITPDVHMNPERCAEIERPRFIKSHFAHVSRYPRVIYIVRDGRDVAVSYFYYLKKTGKLSDEDPFDAYLEEFLDGIGPYGAWDAHIRSWLDSDAPLLLVRYEDLLADARHEFRRILEFTSLEIDDAALAAAVDASSFDSMRKQEEEEHDETHLRDTNSSIRFVRKGQRGTWHDLFTPDMNERFLEATREVMSRLGYC